MDSLKCVEYVDEKRTISAYYHEKLRSGARVGVISSIFPTNNPLISELYL